MRALLIAAALLAGCAHGAASEPGAPTLTGEWVAATRAPQAPTISFEGERASGFAGCNRWFGQVTHAGDQLSFSGVGATRMACEPPVMQIERNFLSVLERTRSYRFVTSNSIALVDESGADLGRFIRQP